MRVIVAARLSQLHDGTGQIGLDTQDEDARDWADDNGHEIVATVGDDVGGKSAMWDRPNLKPWITEPELLSRYDGIVAAKQDRLSRADWSDEARLRLWAEDNGKSLFIVDPQMMWPPRNDSHHDDDVATWNRGAEHAHREWRNTSRRYTRMLKGKISRNSITGRPNYGYEIITLDDGRKTQAPIEPQATYMREAKTRYLNGETVDAIVADFTARAIPAPGKSTVEGRTAKWSSKTIAEYLRSSAYAGRRVNAQGVKVHDGYEALWTMDEHNALVARLDSRAHRKGISPANTALLTSVLFCSHGNALYRINGWQGPMYYSRSCKCSVSVETMDARVNDFMSNSAKPHLLAKTVPGDNHNEEIARKEADQAELMITKPSGWLARMAELETEIEGLRALPSKPNSVEWVKTGKTEGDVWDAMTNANRRDYLMSLGYRFTVLSPSEWRLSVPATNAEGNAVAYERLTGETLSQ